MVLLLADPLSLLPHPLLTLASPLLKGREGSRSPRAELEIDLSVSVVSVGSSVGSSSGVFSSVSTRSESGSSSSSSSASAPLTPTKKSDRLLSKTSTTPPPLPPGFCMWKDCPSATEHALDLLEHIQVRPTDSFYGLALFTTKSVMTKEG